MAIEFQCPNCRQTLRLKEKFAGQRGSCKHCGGEIVVPSPAPADELGLAALDDDAPVKPTPSPHQTVRPVSVASGASSPRSTPASKPQPTPQPKPQQPVRAAAFNAVPNLIRFRCDGCGGLMQSPPSDAGRAVACPRCMQRLRVPGTPSSATAVSSTTRAVATAGPAMGGLELLPEQGGLELLPEANGLISALDDTMTVAPAAAPLKRLPSPRPLSSTTKRRKSERSFWQSRSTQAVGGGLTTLVVLLGIGLRVYFRIVRPMMDNASTSTPLAQNNLAPAPYVSPGPPPPAIATNSGAPQPTPVNIPAAPPSYGPGASGSPQSAQMISDAQNVLTLLEQNLQLARQIVDVPSAQRVAGEWALQFIDAVEAAEGLNRYNGRIVSMSDKQTYEGLLNRAKDQANQIQSHIVQLAGREDILPILADALERGVAARPTSAFAREYRKQAGAYSGMASLSRQRAEMQIRREQRRAEMDARMEKMRADSEARMAEMRERARSGGGIRNPRYPGRK